MEKEYRRYVQASVTNFIHFEDEYLFLHRNKSKSIDPDKLNGIGGRVEAGENYIDASIRETAEETGYKVTSSDLQLSGIVRLEGGYKEDWIMCFFKIKVDSQKIPLGNNTSDGNLIWIHKDAVLDSQYELVDDLHYCFKDIVDGKSLFFMTAQLDKKHKIVHVSKSILKNDL